MPLYIKGFVFTYRNHLHVKLKKYVVTNEFLKEEDIDVFLEAFINELDEVHISQYFLSGNISNDVEKIPTYEDRLPLWNAAELIQMGVIPIII